MEDHTMLFMCDGGYYEKTIFYKFDSEYGDLYIWVSVR